MASAEAAWYELQRRIRQGITNTPLEPAQPVPLGECGHPAWSCACEKHREFEIQEDDPTVQHEPATQEGY